MEERFKTTEPQVLRFHIPQRINTPKCYDVWSPSESRSRSGLRRCSDSIGGLLALSHRVSDGTQGLPYVECLLIRKRQQRVRIVTLHFRLQDNTQAKRSADDSIALSWLHSSASTSFGVNLERNPLDGLDRTTPMCSVVCWLARAWL